MRASVLLAMRGVADGYRRFNRAGADEALPRIAEMPRRPIRQRIRSWRVEEDARRLEPGSAIARQLAQLAEDKAWEQGQDRSLSVARAIYLHLPDGYKLWVRGREFDDLDREAVTEALA